MILNKSYKNRKFGIFYHLVGRHEMFLMIYLVRVKC